MLTRAKKAEVTTLLAVFFVFWIAVTAALGHSNKAQAGAEKSRPAPQATATPPPSPAAGSNSPDAFTSKTILNPRAAREYKLLWGIDNILVKRAAQGSLIRFSFRVVDPDKAKMINDKKLTPYLIDEASRAALQIPEADQIGMFRQTSAPEAGREYWMIFSNKGNYVKLGNRVDIVIGNFRLIGLVVQ